MQLEDPFDTKLCTLKFIIFSILTVLASGLIRKLWWEWERKVGDWLENESEDRDAAKTQLPSCEVCGDVDEYNKKEQQLAKQRKHMTVLRNDHTHRASNSFNEHFAIFLNS